MRALPLLLLTLALAACDDGGDDKDGGDTGPVDTDPAAGADLDDDGFTEDEGDCDDTDPDIYPGAPETWYDGIDSDCAGDDDDDQDKDGARAASQGGTDCDDTDATISPFATDVWYDGIDRDCGGEDDYDQDGDGYVPDEHVGAVTEGVPGSGALPGGDCDDTLVTVNPEGFEVGYDGVDADCDGADDFDLDGDGYVRTQDVGRPTAGVAGSGALPGGDCDDRDEDRNPGVTEVWYDGIDADCGADDDYDQDADGWVRTQDVGLFTIGVPGTGGKPGNDCDDTDDTRNPGATEGWYDGVDQDCDGGSDYDQDGDGQDSDAHGGTDCDDLRDGVYLGAPERCDGLDRDCDGTEDSPNPVDGTDWYVDEDDDEHGSDMFLIRACDEPDFASSTPDDCDDLDPTAHPGAPTIVCDGVDNDCDPATFEPGAGARIDGTLFSDVRAAVLSATTGETVEICEGLHTVNDLVIDAGITVRGLAGREGTVLDAGGVGTVLRVIAVDTVTVQGLTLQGGTGFAGTSPTRGGGFFLAEDTQAVMSDVLVTGNTAGLGAGGHVAADAQLILIDSLVSDNVGDDTVTPVPAGGGLYLADRVTLLLERVAIENNEAGTGAGIATEEDVTIAGSGIDEVSIRRNTASLSGGGLSLNAGALVSDLEVARNEAGPSGGGIEAFGTIRLTDLDVVANDANLQGGGVAANGDVFATRVTFELNEAGIEGGAIHMAFAHVVDLDDCRVSANGADRTLGTAGGVYVRDGTVVSTATDWGDGLRDNPPHDLAFGTDQLVCDYTGVQTFTYVDGSGVGICP